MTSRYPTVAELASWPKPNYIDPVTKRPLALGIMIPMTVLVTVAISARFYSRTVLIRTLGWDDWIMLIAAILTIGSNIMVMIATLPQYQFGYHLWDVRPQIMYGTIKAAQMAMAEQLLFTTVITLMKVAILLTYLRIFPSRLNNWFCRIMLFYTISLNISAFFITLFQCTPASVYWEIFKYRATARCLNIKAIYYFHSSQNTLSDFIIFMWPAKDLLNVQISLRQRVTLTCMFSLGVIVCIAGVMRIYYTHLYLVSYDVFWRGAETFIVMSVESGVGVACGCLPGCKPLMNKLFPRVFNSTTGSSKSRPSAQKRVAALNSGSLSEQSGTREKESFKMQSLSSNGSGLILAEKQLPARPPPPGPATIQRTTTIQHTLSPQVARAFHQNSGRDSRRYMGDTGDESDSSFDFIIQQPTSTYSRC